MKKQSTVASLKDAGYQAAKHGEGMAQVARYVLEECPSFLDGAPDEVKAQLREGQACVGKNLIKPSATHRIGFHPRMVGSKLLSHTV
jgi:hypothetical protein